MRGRYYTALSVAPSLLDRPSRAVVSREVEAGERRRLHIGNRPGDRVVTAVRSPHSLRPEVHGPANFPSRGCDARIQGGNPAVSAEVEVGEVDDTFGGFRILRPGLPCDSR